MSMRRSVSWPVPVEKDIRTTKIFPIVMNATKYVVTDLHEARNLSVYACDDPDDERHTFFVKPECVSLPVLIRVPPVFCVFCDAASGIGLFMPECHHTHVRDLMAQYGDQTPTENPNPIVVARVVADELEAPAEQYVNKFVDAILALDGYDKRSRAFRWTLVRIRPTRIRKPVVDSRAVRFEDET
eukprot:5930797-Pyramimonas_sp.AAC.2